MILPPRYYARHAAFSLCYGHYAIHMMLRLLAFAAILLQIDEETLLRLMPLIAAITPCCHDFAT